MKFLDYIEQASKLELKKENKTLNIAILRSYTCENIEPIIKTELYKDNFNVNIEFGIFNQYYQEALEDDSFLYTKNIDIAIILIRPEDLIPKTFEIDNVKNEYLQAMNKINTIIKNIKEKSNIKAIIMTNMEEYESENEGILDYNSSHSKLYSIKQFNLDLIGLKEKYNNLYLVDVNKIIADIGKYNTYNNKMKYISRDPYKIDYYIELVKYLKRIINKIYYPAKKVLLLDLDNTLYKGILGEDDINQITNFSGYPGEHYKNLQIKIKNLKNRGILLCLVTKNNYQDVEKLFKLEKMPLKLEDFVITKANWEEKYVNIKEISQELNLGLDSFVFIDDNKYEIELINKMIPEVKTINISTNPEIAEKVLDEVYYFDKLLLSKEDEKRTQLYKLKANTNIEHIENIDEFLKELKMKITFKILNINDKDLIERASQMTLKTNQFNMTTKRYSINEIEEIAKDTKNTVIMMFVEDKFGDSGSTGLIILKDNEIDTFLLSCRILKRKLEYCMLQYAQEIVKYKLKDNILKARYIKTDKNIAFKDFYKNAGMKEIENNIYELNTNEKIKNLPDYIEIKK